MLDVCLLGTGGMMPLPNRWLTSLLARYNGSSILIDCGEGTQIAIKEKGLTFKPIDVICFTHFHADHVSGLPGLLLTLGNAERTEPLTIIGPKGVERVVNSLRAIAPELPFKINCIEITEPTKSFNINGYILEAFKVNHNVTCYGYTIKIPRAGKFDPQKAEQNEVPRSMWSKLQKGAIIEENGKTYTQDMILGPERKGIKLTYCTDTRPVSQIWENAKDADLFICEGMYGEPGKEAKAVVEALDGKKLDYPVVMDYEDSSILQGTSTNVRRAEIILAYKKVIEDAGYKFALYANKNWLDNYIDTGMLGDTHIWIARWRSLSSGHGYNGSGKVTMWQYTDKGSVKGISGKVDMDVSYKKYR